jgi:hypothetical protein
MPHLMHRLRGLVAIVGFGFAAAAVVACGSSNEEPKSTASTASTPKTSSSQAPTRSAPPTPVQRPARIRRIESVQASSAPNRPKTTLKVKVARLVKGLQPNSFQLGGSHKGMKFVGVQLTIVNAGRATWSGSPGKVSTLLTNANTQAGTLTAAGTCGGAFSTKVEILPGERQRGCVPFVLKTGQRAQRFQFSPDAPATPPVEWSLRG